MSSNINSIGKTEEAIILSSVVGQNDVVKGSCEKLSSGELLIIDNNTVMHNKHLSFRCEIPDNFSGRILVGHGRDCYSAAHLEITPTHLRIFHNYSGLKLHAEVEHGLNLFGYVTANVDIKYSRGNVTVMTASGMYRWENIAWAGRQGQVFASLADSDADITNVTLNWSCDDYRKTIYLFGDSYFNTNDPGRWPYYLFRDGYMSNFMTGYPGMGSQRAIIDFKLSVGRGTPRYAVWCMGMNNGDKDGVINPDYLAATEEFLSICKERGIIPILSTVPSTPTVNNSYKNAWVKSTGHRYIDFARAVNGDKYDEANLGKKYTKPDGSEGVNVTGYDWYPEMLYPDLVHPASKGAQALYMQVLVDFPEIMQK